MQSGENRSPLLGHVLVTRGFVRWEQYRLKEAAADFAAGIAQLRPTGSARSLLIAGLQYAMIRLLLADQAAAALEVATTWLNEANSSQMTELYRATMAHIALLHTRRTDAANWIAPAQRVDPTAGGLTACLTEYSLMLQALEQSEQPEPGLDRAYLHALLSAFHPSPEHSTLHVQGLLTPREQDVLRLLAVGTSNRRIAHTLVISEETVKTYRKKIYRKLDAGNRLEAVTRARALGYL